MTEEGIQDLEEMIAACEQLEQLMPLWRDISSVWTMPVIHALAVVERIRFNELKKWARPISATSLTERLRTFERRGFVQRKQYPEIPPRVEYSLTERGRELWGSFDRLTKLGMGWLKEDAEVAVQRIVAEAKL